MAKSNKKSIWKKSWNKAQKKKPHWCPTIIWFIITGILLIILFTPLEEMLFAALITAFVLK